MDGGVGQAQVLEPLRVEAKRGLLWNLMDTFTVGS